MRRALAVLLVLAAIGMLTGNLGAFDQATAPPVVVSAWSESLVLPFGALVRIGVTVENHGPTPLHGVHIEELDADGFTHAGGCWSTDGQPACDTHDVAIATTDVPANGAWIAGARLAANVDGGKYQPTGIVSWTDSTGLLHRQSLAFPVIEVQAPEHFPSAALVFWATGIGFPGLIAFVGWVVSRVQKTRDDAAHKRSEDAAKAARKQQSRRVEEMTILRLMMRRAHADAESHYMPISIAAAEFGAVVDKYTKNTATIEDVTKRLVLLHRSIFEMATRIGGFYFKNRDGEKLTRTCWALFLVDGIRANVDQTVHMQLVGAVSQTDDWATVGTTLNSRQNRAAFQYVAAKVALWAEPGNLIKQAALIETMREVLGYEMNRTYELWYGSKDKFPADELTTLAKDLDALAQATPENPGIAELVIKLRSYVDRRGEPA